jgi:hypothetical protein
MKHKNLISVLCKSILLAALTLSACSAPTTTPMVITPTTPVTTAPEKTLPVTAVPPGTPVPLTTQPVVKNPDFGLVCEPNPEFDFSQVLVTTPFYIQGQVILTGPVEEFANTLDKLAQAGINLTPVIRCTLSIPEQMPVINQGEGPFRKEPKGEGRDAKFPFSANDGLQPSVEGNRLAMNLYKIEDPQVSVINIIQALNDIQEGRPPQASIYADPNYLTGHMANTACGNPFGVEGSPFGVEGSPFGVEGSPYGGMGLDADANGFWDQWAFTQVGLNPPDGRDFEETGERVRVGVFDTSPYRIDPGDPPTPFTNPNITPELKLTVHYPTQLSNLSATTPVTAQVNVEDHGLFVSSLIHAFAPQSQIHLYQVLNEAGCGDMYRLNVAMLDFLSADWNSEGQRLSQPAVINLSLGVRKPRNLPPAPADATAEAEIGQMEEAIQQAYDVARADPSIESLETVTQLASQAGMVIVAAGGNDSVINAPPPPHMPLPMELPADYPYVIGVSASTDRDINGPACYSNQGDVAAPGGDAKEDVDSSGDPICVSQAATCPASDRTSPNTPGSCGYGVIGLSTLSKNTGYAYWVGTSFATPMVSGLAALVYQPPRSQGDTWTRVTTKVNTSIPDHQYGKGLIDVKAALQP